MAALETEPKPTSWGLWLRWVGANIAGMVLAMGIEANLFGPLGVIMMGGIAVSTKFGFAVARIVAVVLFTIIPGIIGALAMGTIGALQWLVLRRYLPSARKWLIANALGGALAGIATLGPLIVAAETSAHRPDARQAPLGAILFIVDLLIIGIAQWLVMRQHLPQSGWWVLASAVSGLPGAVLLLLRFGLIWAIVGIMLIPLLYPIVTGIALVWLVRRSATAFS